MFFHLLPLHALQIFAYEDTILFYNKEQTPKERKTQICNITCTICRVQLLVLEKFS